MNNFGLYIVITKPHLDYSLFVQTCVEESVQMIQLREKHLSYRDLLALANKLKDITKGSKTKLILNDFPDIALQAQADGVHLGPDDMDLSEAMKICNESYIYGVSTHSYAEALTLINQHRTGIYGIKPDYMSFGPIYATPTKEIPDKPVGKVFLSNFVKISPMPLVAIGGIFPENIYDVLACGVQNIAMVRYFTESRELSELKDKIRNIQTIMKENSL